MAIAVFIHFFSFAVSASGTSLCGTRSSLGIVNNAGITIEFPKLNIWLMHIAHSTNIEWQLNGSMHQAIGRAVGYGSRLTRYSKAQGGRLGSRSDRSCTSEVIIFAMP